MSRGHRQRKTGNWVARQQRDVYVRQAREQGLRARAAFKLEQITAQYGLIGPDTRILDLGCAPGSWCQYAATRVRTAYQILGVDLLPMQPIAGVQFVQGDFSATAIRQQIYEFFRRGQADLVLSDMAPNITGITVRDQTNAETLQHAVLALCAEVLKPGGKLLTKLFEGENMPALRQHFADQFAHIRMLKPKASRAGSREVYLLGTGFGQCTTPYRV